MKRLTINQNNKIKVKDIYGKMHDCKDVPNEFYGCIRKLYDCLLNPSVVNIRMCLHMIDYILNTKEKDR